MPVSVDTINKTIAFVVKNNGTIADVARNLGMTIVEVSKIVDQYRELNAKVNDILAQKGWPTNLKEGYIYIGGYELTVPDGVRNGLLKKGMNVLAQKLPRRSKGQKYDYYMLYLPYKKISRKHNKAKLIIVDNKITGATYLRDDLDKIKTEWLIDGEDYSKYKKELRLMNIILQPTETTKEVLFEGKELGVTASHTIVNVKYDWT